MTNEEAKQIVRNAELSARIVRDAEVLAELNMNEVSRLDRENIDLRAQVRTWKTISFVFFGMTMINACVLLALLA